MNQDGGNFAVEDITELIQLGESYIGRLSTLNLLIDPIEMADIPIAATR